MKVKSKTYQPQAAIVGIGGHGKKVTVVLNVLMFTILHDANIKVKKNFDEYFLIDLLSLLL